MRPQRNGEPAIVYFGNDWFAENRTSSHHIADKLSRQFPLLYIESPGFRAPKANTRDFRKLWRKLLKALRRPRRIHEQMWHMTMPQIPFRSLPLVNRLNLWTGRFLVRRAMKYVGIHRAILWFAVPHTAAMVGQLGEDYVVYYCIDDYALLPDIDHQEIGRMDAELARGADQVFVSSPALLEPKKRLNPHTIYSPHGVDVDLFRRALEPDLPVAAEAKDLPRPVIGFFGLIEAWMDLELIAFLARSRPDWTFLMIGRVAVDVSLLRELRNVIFTGPQPYQMLPNWAKAFNVSIIPFRQNDLVRSVNPLKLREYLATGSPVVSVWMPEVERFAELVGIARTHEEFLLRIEDALCTDNEEKRQARMRSVATMTWAARVDEVIGLVRQRMEEKLSLSPARL